MSKKTESKIKVMTVKEVSEFLRIPLSTVYDLTQKGKLRAAKIGKHWRYLDTDVTAYLIGVPVAEKAGHDRRQSPRINTHLSATLELPLQSTPSSLQNVSIINLSAGGAYLISDNPACPVGLSDPVKVTFKLAHSENLSLTVEGRVVHQKINGHSAFGIKFRRLPAKYKEVLRDYVG